MLTRNQVQGMAQSQSQGPTPRREEECLLFDGYQRHPTAWDELFAAPGRPHAGVRR